MKVVTFLGTLGLGGTEKAACRWARGLKARGHDIILFTLMDGPRRAEAEAGGVPVRLLPASAHDVAEALREFAPVIIHAHAPGYPYIGDVLGEALPLLPTKIPVVQTNIFGRLENPKEDEWTDYRLFISWTSCVQAARRSFRRMDGSFFRRCSVAVYPVDPLDESPASEVREFRTRLGVSEDEVLFGRLSRPEPNKWTALALDAFRSALSRNGKMKLLLREPPPQVAATLRAMPDARQFIILPVTADADELRLTLSALDVVLHTSSVGESFGYGIAEPMNLAKPVITHSLPWQDQAQLELVKHGECGFVAGTAAAMTAAILRLATDVSLRQRMGEVAQQHIRALSDPETSITRLERVFQAALGRRDNPFAVEDLRRAQETAAYLDAHQFGHTLGEQLALRPFYWRVRFHQFRRALRSRFASRASNSPRR